VAFIKEVDSNTYAGDLVGAVTDTYTFRLFPNGTVNGQGTEICYACTLGGRTGGFTAIFRFRASGDTFTGTETFLRGTGGLTGLRGGGTFQGSGAGNTYRYSYDFEP
jgi:hypothetical protein